MFSKQWDMKHFHIISMKSGRASAAHSHNCTSAKCKLDAIISNVVQLSHSHINSKSETDYYHKGKQQSSTPFLK